MTATGRAAGLAARRVARTGPVHGARTAPSPRSRPSEPPAARRRATHRGGAARAGQRPQPRLPPRPPRPHPRRRRHLLDLAAADVRASPAGSIPTATSHLARAVYAEMALAGYTAVGEFHYLHHAPGGRPYADPNAMGARADRGGDRGRHPAHPAGHLLPGRRADARRATSRWTRCRCGSATATSSAGRTASVELRRRPERPDRGRDPLGPRGARPPTWPRSPPRPATGRCTSISASSRPRTRRPQALLRLLARPSCWPITGSSARGRPRSTPPT